MDFCIGVISHHDILLHFHRHLNRLLLDRWSKNIDSIPTTSPAIGNFSLLGDEIPQNYHLVGIDVGKVWSSTTDPSAMTRSTTCLPSLASVGILVIVMNLDGGDR
ncbi:unnamed protein product [Linum trigynum]|uniref:Uncharacterized protein n=1 Tax=Linum trigynum TaxID=586398 RepID=A0AAV2DAM0_9ROSI